MMELTSIRRSREAQEALKTIYSHKITVRLAGRILIDRLRREYEFVAGGILYRSPVHPSNVAALMEHRA